MSGDKKAIIVIHGIGDQEQRATLEAFVKCCNSGKQPAGGTTQLLRSPAVGPDVQPFSYFVQETVIAGKPSIVAEMYWSDLSKITTGFLASLRNFLNLMVAAPDIVNAGLGPRLLPDGTQRDYLILRALRSLVALGFWTMFLVGVAYSITYAVLFLAFVLDIQLLRPGIGPDARVNAMLVPILVAVSGIAALLASRIKQAYLRALLRWATVMTVGASIIVILDVIAWVPPRTYREYSRLINGTTLFLILIPGSIYHLFFVLLPFLLLRFPGRWRGLLLAFITLAVLMGFWMDFFLTMGLLLVTNAYTESQSKMMFDETYRTFFFMGTYFLALIGFAMVLIMSYGVHQVKSQRAMAAGVRHGDFPRLIVPSLLIPYVVLLAVASIGFHWTCLPCLEPPCEQCLAPTEVTKWFLTNAWWVLLMGGLVIQLFPEGFKLANDIVNYFSDPLHQTTNPFYAMTSAFTLQIGNPRSFRGQVRGRFLAMCADLDKTFGPFTDADVIGYSLGSMIAIDALCAEPRAFGNSNTRVRLITLGSPYKNIFHHYFPHQFSKLTRERLAGVAECINIFRVNDYVGGPISDGVDFVNERCHLPKGHLGYFSDRKVIDEFLEIDSAQEPGRIA